MKFYGSSEISRITNANEVFETLAKGFSRYKDILDQSHVSSGPTLVDVLDRLIRMEVVKREGYAFYEAKFRKEPVTDSMIRQEMEQVRSTGLHCYKYGFIPAGNEPSGCASIHLANAARVKYPAACCAARLIPRQLAAGFLISRSGFQCGQYEDVVLIDMGQLFR